MSSDTSEFLVRASYCEIYNENVRDLLSTNTKRSLQLKQHPERGVYVKDLTWSTVSNAKEIDTIMRRGFSNRAVGQTDMNAESSRSHSIFTIVIEVNEPDAQGNDHFRQGKLNLVDLAGSERATRTPTLEHTLTPTLEHQRSNTLEHTRTHSNTNARTYRTKSNNNMRRKSNVRRNWIDTNESFKERWST